MHGSLQKVIWCREAQEHSSGKSIKLFLFPKAIVDDWEKHGVKLPNLTKSNARMEKLFGLSSFISSEIRNFRCHGYVCLTVTSTPMRPLALQTLMWRKKSVEEEEDGGINGLKCHARINNNEITEIDCGLDWRFYALAHKINTPYTASHHPAHKLPVQQCKNNISLFLP